MIYLNYFKNQGSYLKPLALGCFLIWVLLLGSSFFIDNGIQKVSAIAAKIEFFVSIMTIIFVVKRIKDSKKNKEIFYWLLLISSWVLVLNICFYISVYIGNNFLVKLSVANLVLYFAPCIVYKILMVAFLSKMLLTNGFELNRFIKIVGAFSLFNGITLYLFLSSIHYAFPIVSFQIISQIVLLCTALILFGFSIFSLIYANDKGMILFLIGTIAFVAGDFFLTYSYLSQTINVFSYGEFLWLLGLLCIMVSIPLIKKDSISGEALFRKSNMLKSKLVFWTYNLSMGSFLLFFMIAYAFSIVNTEMFLWLPLFVMIYSIIVVTLAIRLGSSFEAPFIKISNNINQIMIENNKEKLDDHFSIEEFILLQKYIVETFEIREEKDRVTRQLGEIAAQVAHDIASPLAALNITLVTAEKMPEDVRRLIKSSVARIRDISSNLLESTRKNDLPFRSDEKKIRPCMIAPTVESLISEKRMQLSESSKIDIALNIEAEAQYAFVQMNASDFKCILSNLINNSVEAIEQAGNIFIHLKKDAEYLSLTVNDNGKGIPENILHEIGSRGKTYGKPNGNGLGIYHAKSTLDLWGAAFSIESELGSGTKITIKFREEPAPIWFKKDIEISSYENIVVLDNDVSMHEIWKKKLMDFGLLDKIKFFSFFDPKGIYTWLSKTDLNDKENALFLVDYDLGGFYETGLSVIKALKLENVAILVTQAFEDVELLSECVEHNIKVIPKSLVPYLFVSR